MHPGWVLLGLLQAAQPKATRAPDGVVVTPGTGHGGGWLHQFLLGQGWRELWTTSIRAPVLNLDRIGGGLEAQERGGHAQSKTLRFCAEDGRMYSFRSVDKDPSQ